MSGTLGSHNENPFFNLHTLFDSTLPAVFVSVRWFNVCLYHEIRALSAFAVVELGPSKITVDFAGNRTHPNALLSPQFRWNHFFLFIPPLNNQNQPPTIFHFEIKGSFLFRFCHQKTHEYQIILGYKLTNTTCPKFVNRKKTIFN